MLDAPTHESPHVTLPHVSLTEQHHGNRSTRRADKRYQPQTTKPLNPKPHLATHHSVQQAIKTG